MKKLLITGASGFIGQAVIKEIFKNNVQDFEVYAVISGRKNVDFPSGVHIIKTDLLNNKEREELIKRISPDYMLHLAWNLEVNNYRESMANIQWLEVSLHLLRLFIEFGGQKIFLAGSGAEYSSRSGGRYKENYTPPILDLYGECKRTLYNVVSNICKKENVSYVEMRYFSVYGECDDIPDRGIVVAIQQFTQKKYFKCKFPNNVWDNIHIDDAAAATVKVLRSDYNGVVNIGSGKPQLMKDVFMTIAQKMNCPELLIFDEDNDGDTIWVADTTILNKQIGYICEVDFDSGIRRTIEWWKKKG